MHPCVVVSCRLCRVSHMLCVHRRPLVQRRRCVVKMNELATSYSARARRDFIYMVSHHYYCNCTAYSRAWRSNARGAASSRVGGWWICGGWTATTSHKKDYVNDTTTHCASVRYSTALVQMYSLTLKYGLFNILGSLGFRFGKYNDAVCCCSSIKIWTYKKSRKKSLVFLLYKIGVS